MAAKDGWRGRFFEDFEVGDVYRHPGEWLCRVAGGAGRPPETVDIDPKALDIWVLAMLGAQLVPLVLGKVLDDPTLVLVTPT